MLRSLPPSQMHRHSISRAATSVSTVFKALHNFRIFYKIYPTGYVPAANGHYVENTGNTTLRFLEVFKTDTFQDVSLAQVCLESAIFGNSISSK